MDNLEAVDEVQLKEEIGKMIVLGVGLAGVRGILENDERGFYVGGLRGGIRYYISNGEIVTLEQTLGGKSEVKEYVVSFLAG